MAATLLCGKQPNWPKFGIKNHLVYRETRGDFRKF